MAQLRGAAHAKRRRSVAKSISWRVLASIDTFVIASFATGRLTLGAFIASAEVVTKMALYYVHERAWAHVVWGLRG
jgi:uncharacterized membrane protein